VFRFMGSQLWRPITFVLVGGLCFAVQCGVLTGLEAAGFGSTFANAVGFVLSAQVNFGLSSAVTWGDRPASSPAQAIARWACYQVNVGLALAVNLLVFAVTVGPLGWLLAAAAGVVGGTVVTYSVNHRLIFRPVTARAEPVEVAA
jgi:putative flippase GtrA